MAYQPVPDVAHITLEGTVDGQVTINDLYFEVSGGGITPINLGALLLAVSVYWTTNVVPLLSEDWTAVAVSATDLTTATGPSLETAVGVDGGVAGEAAPNNVAACVSFATAQRGRSSRGRNYVPAVPNSVITLNTMSTTFISNLSDAYNGMAGPGALAAGWQWVVVSRQTAGALRPTGLAIPVVAATMKSVYVKSMRSRLVGHGA